MKKSLTWWLSVAGINLTVFVTLVIALEALLYLVFAFPPPVTAVLNAARKYHATYERRTLHFMRSCFKHDPRFSYVLRPEGCVYSSREFNIDIKPNSAGFRDSEDALNAPEIIAIGDSHTFGWGVAAREAYPQILHRMTGMKTLNAGMPSYGTYRETEQLDRINLSAAKYIVLQYSDNDMKENAVFVAAGNRLSIMRPQDYRLLGSKEYERISNKPAGQYLRRFWPMLVDYLQKKPKPENIKKQKRKHREQARLFLKILSHSQTIPEQVPIIVFEINSYNKNDSYFISALRNALTGWKSRSSKPVIPVDLSGVLTDRHYYKHDDHMRPAGQKVVAQKIMEVINSTLKTAADQ